jgi:hypothetical protein
MKREDILKRFSVQPGYDHKRDGIKIPDPVWEISYTVYDEPRKERIKAATECQAIEKLYNRRPLARLKMVTDPLGNTRRPYNLSADFDLDAFLDSLE